MCIDLGLTPGGRLRLVDSGGDSGTVPGAWMKRMAAAFSASTAQGLFSLAAAVPDLPSPAVFVFWRDFACRYLSCVCRTPGFFEPSPPPDGATR